MHTFTTHLARDPWLNRCVVVVAHLLDGYPMAQPVEIVTTCLQRYGSKPVYYRDSAGNWCELVHNGINFVMEAEPESPATLDKLKREFPLR